MLLWNVPTISIRLFTSGVSGVLFVGFKIKILLAVPGGGGGGVVAGPIFTGISFKSLYFVIIGTAGVSAGVPAKKNETVLVPCIRFAPNSSSFHSIICLAAASSYLLV